MQAILKLQGKPHIVSAIGTACIIITIITVVVAVVNVVVVVLQRFRGIV